MERRLQRSEQRLGIVDGRSGEDHRELVDADTANRALPEALVQPARQVGDDDGRCIRSVAVGDGREVVDVEHEECQRPVVPVCLVDGACEGIENVRAWCDLDMLERFGLAQAGRLLQRDGRSRTFERGGRTSVELLDRLARPPLGDADGERGLRPALESVLGPCSEPRREPVGAGALCLGKQDRDLALVSAAGDVGRARRAGQPVDEDGDAAASEPEVDVVPFPTEKRINERTARAAARATSRASSTS